MSGVPEDAVIRLSRLKNPWRNRAARFDVFIDGSKAGEIRWGEIRDFSVSVGEHRVVLTISRRWKSKELQLSLKAGEVKRLICGPGSSTFDITALFRPHSYIRLEPEAEPTT
jgi:hypothetical protein